MYRFVYLFVLIGVAIGGWTFLETMAYADSAPQQAAGAAMALAWAVLPYCLARAIEKIGEVTFSEALEKQSERQEIKHAVTRTNPPPKFDPYTGQPLSR